MPAEIVVIANLWAREDSIDSVVALLSEMAAYTHEHEPDTLRFALTRDTEDPLHLTVIEAYPVMAALEAHRTSDIYKELMAQLPDLLAGRERLVLNPIACGDSEKGYVA